jgi:uncharacterized protein YkwD
MLAARLVRLAALLVALGACGGMQSGCSSAPTGTFGGRRPQIKATPEVAALEREMFGRLNQDRKKEALPPLTYDEQLADVARAHCADMRANRFFSHESPATGTLENRLDAAGYLALEARENLASAPTVQRAEDNLLASPGQRANVLSTTVSHVGIGIVHGDATTGDPGLLTITQVFARPTVLQSPTQVAAAVTSAIAADRRSAKLSPLESDPFLDALARKHLDALPLDLDSAVIDRIGQAVASELSAQRGHGLKSVEISAQIVFSASQFDVPSAAKKPEATRLGVAVDSATDPRGRPQLKVIALVGR